MNSAVIPGAQSKHHRKRCDLELRWVLTLCGPEMEPWRSFAERWMAVQTRGLGRRLEALRVFLQDYVHPHGLHHPAEFLRRGTRRPL